MCLKVCQVLLRPDESLPVASSACGRSLWFGCLGSFPSFSSLLKALCSLVFPVSLECPWSSFWSQLSCFSVPPPPEKFPGLPLPQLLAEPPYLPQPYSLIFLSSLSKSRAGTF